jgi:hypothetical protein
MQLTQADLAQLEEVTGQPWRDFAAYDGHAHVILKNRGGHCIFFSPTDKKCIVYDARPLGCQIYPLVYDTDAGKCAYDEDCPHPREVSPPKFVTTRCRLIKQKLAEFYFSTPPASTLKE